MAILALLAAMCAAVRDFVGRAIPAGVPVLIATFTTLVAVMLFAAAGAVLFEPVEWPRPWTMLLMAASGSLLILEHASLLSAYRLAPFLYAFTVAAMIARLVVLGAWPNRLAFTGIALIIASGIAVVLTERTPAAADPASASASGAS